jgi:hypothetical protein
MGIVAGVGKQADRWRLAFMFDAPGSDREALSKGLVAAGPALRGAAQDAHLRFGVAEQFMNGPGAPPEYQVWRSNDGAVEITVAAQRADELPAIAAAIWAILSPLAAPGSAEVMAGPMFSMVPTREGDLFLSLAFKRDPAITKQAFSRWWFHRHSTVAIPVLGKQLLAYDQVHCDDAMTQAVSDACGLPAMLYDAYDNLTWASFQDFQASTSDPVGGQQINEDEIGAIDNLTRRHALMTTLG